MIATGFQCDIRVPACVVVAVHLVFSQPIRYDVLDAICIGTRRIVVASSYETHLEWLKIASEKTA